MLTLLKYKQICYLFLFMFLVNLFWWFIEFTTLNNAKYNTKSGKITLNNTKHNTKLGKITLNC